MKKLWGRRVTKILADEPTAMRDYLVAAGVPAADIVTGRDPVLGQPETSVQDALANGDR